MLQRARRVLGKLNLTSTSSPITEPPAHTDSPPVPSFSRLSQLVTADGSNQSDNCSEIPHSEIDSRIGGGGGGVGSNMRKPSMGPGAGNQGGGGMGQLGGGGHMNIPPNPLTYQSASVMSSDLDSTSLFETESEITLDRDMTECSSVQRLQVRKKPQRRKKRAPSMSRTSSYSSITDSTMSLNIITVSINMEAVNFLGISIVGQSNRGGDGGIYVGSIMKGGAVALDGRIEPGDMILQARARAFDNCWDILYMLYSIEFIQITQIISLFSIFLLSI